MFSRNIKPGILGLGIASKEIFLVYSTQFVFSTVRLVPGNVVMVAIDMCGKRYVFKYLRCFYCTYYLYYKISVFYYSFFYYFCVDGHLGGCVVTIIVTVVVVAFIYLFFLDSFLSFFLFLFIFY